jgi:hypothetical protein
MPPLNERLFRRSVVLVEKLEHRQRDFVFYWLAIAVMCCALRLALAPLSAMGLHDHATATLSYALLVAAPAVSLLLALGWFRNGEELAPPIRRLVSFGRWRSVSLEQARAANLYGVSGLMASLLLGILLNIPVRTLEFFAAIPSLGAAPPAWFKALFFLMLFDAVLLCSLYAIAFAAALKKVPFFPRLLALTWLIDVVMQLGIGRVVQEVPGFPPGVLNSLEELLNGNLKKVLISVTLWAPYLLLSRRVNVTYRRRVRV